MQMRESVVGNWRMGGAASTIRFRVISRGLHLECGRVLHEILLVHVLMYGSETMLWKERKKSRIRAVQLDNLRGFLGIRKTDRIPNHG